MRGEKLELSLHKVGTIKIKEKEFLVKTELEKVQSPTFMTFTK